jgi:predicted lipid-binding transport protein (Tim44 family)
MTFISVKRAIPAVFLVLSVAAMGFYDSADARSSSGGRSFGGSSSSGSSRSGSSGSFGGGSSSGFGSGSSKSFGSPSGPSSPSLPPPPPPASGSSTFNRTAPSSSGGGSSFLKGVGGGLVGGMIGNMIFGRSGYSGGGGYGGGGNYGGSGGVGGSSIGFFELLIMAGIGYFLYKRFIKPNMGSRNTPPNQSPIFPGNAQSTGFQAPPAAPPAFPSQTSADDFDFIRQTEPDFNPDKFKEIAQDVFFKVQAAWMRRDTSSVQNLIGQQLKSEYDTQFAEMKQQGLINRLENIAVRSIEIVDAGMEGQEAYIKVLFTANLLDYTVEESSGKTVKGDSTNPVKFEEYWTFARPVNSTSWKLEGIQVK